MAPGKSCSKCFKSRDTPANPNSIKPIDSTYRSALNQQSPDDSMMTPLSNHKSHGYEPQLTFNSNRGRKEELKLNRSNYQDMIDSHTGRNE